MPLDLIALDKARKANRPEPKMSWSRWLAAVLTHNNRHSDLSANELTFLHKRHEDNLKPDEVFI